MHLVERRAQLPVDEGHDAQHDVVVVRSGMINDLVLERLDPTPELGLRVVDDLLHDIEAQVRNPRATRVIP